MIERYTRNEMGRIWEPDAKFAKWLAIELYACEAWRKKGKIPASALKRIRKKARFDLKRINEIEKTVKHDVIAFLTSVGEHLGKDSRYMHLGLTSSDVLDTAFALSLRDAADVIIDDIKGLLKVLRRRAFEHKNTVMMGRSHGVHAEPTTFGLKLALFYEEMKRNLERAIRAKDVISYGKISGAVGTFANIDPFIERYVLKKLGLKPEPVATQVVQRDRHAEFFLTLSIIAASVEKIAIEIRHLQRTEVMEAEEPFTIGQKGSSAMPHKRNPVLSENLTGLARLVRGYGVAALENVALWHERDISHSSVERVIGPDSTIVLDFMLARITEIIDGMAVYPERMKENMEISRGLAFSQKVLLKLADRGLSREKAYGIVQRDAMKVWKGKTGFKTVCLNDKELMRHLTPEDVEECFGLKSYLKNIDYIFKRVFR
ncbi:MAG TPA: adenylosuccinate lyase [Thermodesulfobacteriota bacterium]|nr:adenylosuccinate lyase [Thermodesulfobacteriota bacterium]